MKVRRHHNNSGSRQIRRGKTSEQVERICRKLNLPFRRSKADPSPLSVLPANLHAPGSIFPHFPIDVPMPAGTQPPRPPDPRKTVNHMPKGR